MKTVLNISLIVTLFVAISSCNSSSASPTDQQEKPAEIPIASQTFKVNNGWGYSIFINNKLFIRQTFIPVIEGNNAFAKEADAKKVADLVVNKLKQHKKPILQLDELQQAGIVAVR